MSLECKAVKALRQGNLDAFKIVCERTGFDVFFNKFLLFRLAAESGRINFLQVLMTCIPDDYPSSNIFIICMDAALLEGQLEMAEFIFQQYPLKLSTMESHLRLFYFLGSDHDLKMLNFLITHYHFPDDSINACFESFLQMGRLKFTNLFLDSPLYVSVLQMYIIGDRFDWNDLSADPLSYECISATVDRVEKHIDLHMHMHFLVHSNFLQKLTPDCLAFIAIRRNSRNQAARRIQRWFKQNAAYKIGSKSAERLAKEQWLKL
jgi:hypothetical protein